MQWVRMAFLPSLINCLRENNILWIRTIEQMKLNSILIELKGWCNSSEVK